MGAIPQIHIVVNGGHVTLKRHGHERNGSKHSRDRRELRPQRVFGDEQTCASGYFDVSPQATRARLILGPLASSQSARFLDTFKAAMLVLFLALPIAGDPA